MTIAIVIPTLDEELRLPQRLSELAAMPEVSEIVVADGGSSDGTRAIAEAHPRVRVVASARGRARQMNAGAAVTHADVLLFLHADVALPFDGPAWIARALADRRVVAGAFRTWTVADQREDSWLAPLLHFADLRSRYSGLPYGDQALFVRADAFRCVGGFAELPLMEDLDLSRRLRRLGRIRVVPARVRVSGRRFLARPIFYTLLVNALPIAFRMGVPPAALARLYGNPR